MKVPLAAIIIIVALTAAVGAYYYFGSGSNLPAKEQQNTVTGLEIAKKINDYIATQKRLDGFYNYATSCSPPDCNYDKFYQYTNTWPVYANTAMFEATGDPAYLETAKTDADKMLGFCSNDPSKCLWVTYQIGKLYNATGDKSYSNFVGGTDSLIIGANYSEDALLFSVESIELADAYKITGDQKFLQESMKRQQQAELETTRWPPIYFVDNKPYSDRPYNLFGCWPQLANAYIFMASNNQTYLNSAESFVSSMNMANHTKSFWMMTDTQACVDLYLTLNDLTGNATYADGAHQMTQYIITNFWDSKANPKVMGDDAIKSFSDRNVSAVTDSSYMVYLLGRQKNQEFVVN